MQENSSEYKVPSFAKPKGYLFEPITKKNNSVYEELNEIAEEIERCRLRNC